MTCLELLNVTIVENSAILGYLVFPYLERVGWVWMILFRHQYFVFLILSCYTNFFSLDVCMYDIFSPCNMILRLMERTLSGAGFFYFYKITYPSLKAGSNGVPFGVR